SFDSNGNAVAVWQQSDGTHFNIWSNRYSAGTGWGTAAKIETDDTGDALSPIIAVTPDGHAVATWYQSDAVQSNTWANELDPVAGWGTAAQIDTNNAGSSGYPRVTIDPAGEAIVVWHKSAGGTTNIWSNRYVPGTGWGTAALIESGAGSAIYAHI